MNNAKQYLTPLVPEKDLEKIVSVMQKAFLDAAQWLRRWFWFKPDF